MQQYSFKRYEWNDIRDEIIDINPELGKIIDELSPSAEYSLYAVEYPYGAMILDKGIFQIYNEQGKLVPLQHSSISSDVKKDLNYTGTIPMGMIVNNSIETFFSVGERTVPSSFYCRGDMISLWRVLEGDCSYQEGPLWSISSGAKTICMLPKITDKVGLKALQRKYALNINLSNFQHWEILSGIAKHQNFEQQWSSKVLYFSEEWMLHRDDPAWSRFYYYLLNKAWNDSTFKRNQFIFDFAFSLVQRNKNLKPNPYLADTVKHLIGIGTSGMPAFKPATSDEAAPISGLEQVFIEDYGLKKYMPLIMQLSHLDLNNPSIVYYSLDVPTTTIFSPRSSRTSSKMNDIKEIKDIIYIFISETLKNNLLIEKTPLYNLSKNVLYEFHHRDQDKFNDIPTTMELVGKDADFQTLIDKYQSRVFPEYSSFFNGCVSIINTRKGSK